MLDLRNQIIRRCGAFEQVCTDTEGHRTSVAENALYETINSRRIMWAVTARVTDDVSDIDEACDGSDDGCAGDDDLDLDRYHVSSFLLRAIISCV